MYGYLTLEQCYTLEEQDFAVVCDGDRKDCYIRDAEKEFIASNIPDVSNYFADLYIGLKKIFADILHGLGKFFNKIGDDLC